MNYVKHPDNSHGLESSYSTSDTRYEKVKILPQSVIPNFVSDSQYVQFLISKSVGEIESIGLEFTLKNIHATDTKNNVSFFPIFWTGGR